MNKIMAMAGMVAASFPCSGNIDGELGMMANNLVSSLAADATLSLQSSAVSLAPNVAAGALDTNKLNNLLSFSLWQQGTATKYATADKLQSPEYVNASQFINIWENSYCKQDNLLYLTFNATSILPGYTPTAAAPEPYYVLQVFYNVPSPSNFDPRIPVVSIAVSGTNNVTPQIYADLETGQNFRIIFPAGTLTTDVVLTFIFNGYANSATYTSTPDPNTAGNVIFSGTATSCLLTTGTYSFSKSMPQAATDPTYTFQDYSATDIVTICDVVALLKQTLQSCIIRKSISQHDLDVIRASCSCDKLRCSAIQKICKKRKQLKCNLETTFHKYISFCVTSIKSMCVFTSSRGARCKSIFSKCARKCEDRYEGCNVAMLLISSKFKISVNLRAAIEGCFETFMGCNPYLNLNYKAAARCYCYNRSDCRRFEKYIGEDFVCEEEDECDEREEIVDDDHHEGGRRDDKRAGFFGRFKWVIAVSVVVTVVACAAYAFAF